MGLVGSYPNLLKLSVIVNFQFPLWLGAIYNSTFQLLSDLGVLFTLLLPVSHYRVVVITPSPSSNLLHFTEQTFFHALLHTRAGVGNTDQPSVKWENYAQSWTFPHTLICKERWIIISQGCTLLVPAQTGRIKCYRVNSGQTVCLGSENHRSHLLAVQAWATNFASLCLCFFSCWTGRMAVPTLTYSAYECVAKLYRSTGSGRAHAVRHLQKTSQNKTTRKFPSMIIYLLGFRNFTDWQNSRFCTISLWQDQLLYVLFKHTKRMRVLFVV